MPSATGALLDGFIGEARGLPDLQQLTSRASWAQSEADLQVA